MSLLLWTMSPARVWRRMHGQGCIFRCFKCLFLLHLRHKTFPYVWILICLSVLWLASILLPLISQCLWWILKWFKRSVLTALQTLLQLCLIRGGEELPSASILSNSISACSWQSLSYWYSKFTLALTSQRVYMMGTSVFVEWMR